VDSVEQVRRQHAMFARLLGEEGPPSPHPSQAQGEPRKGA
jgi:hypothetical protein